MSNSRNLLLFSYNGAVMNELAYILAASRQTRQNKAVLGKQNPVVAMTKNTAYARAYARALTPIEIARENACTNAIANCNNCYNNNCPYVCDEICVYCRCQGGEI